MSFSTTNETISITLPNIPGLSSHPFSVTIPTSTLRTLLRLVVIVATYLLFRPQLEAAFKKAMGGDGTPQSVEGMQKQMKKFEELQGKPIGGGKKIAVATGSGEAVVSGQSTKVRRKA